MTDWYQQAMSPPEVIEARLRLGFVPERNHVQAMVELVDPITSVQIAQWSCPHAEMDGWFRLLDEAVAKVQRYVGDAIEPF